ncbi:glycosyltransferase family 2 protein [Chryseobacterium sp. POL2]|uniref:glycosyltransferase family 2 protein n=1 Tax=Chryseobacterium sp. POL2 TaxID=2713414 RepID=UPI0013E1C097|nr:glycosyltransferase family 2 protein [Chryseobacterium sp. POL2]QIG90563.1 glycosyltransferase family 2 protein [Chryseobacterium sp. POL2]
MTKISVVIVHYNVADLLRNCILSINQFFKDIDYEILVVDNWSPNDDWKKLIEEFTQVKFIASEKNHGFSIANNIGVEKAKGEYVLILNPDTEIESFYIKELLDFADSEPKFGCLGVRMHDKNGEFLPESKRSVPDMWNSFEKLFTPFSKKSKAKSYYRNDIGEYDVAKCDVFTGAFLLVKKKVYQEVGGFDEAYFMYGEDIDLCYTIAQHGYQNYYYGKCSILHYKGESTMKDEVYLQRFYGAMQIFVEKYYKKQKPLQYFVLNLGLKLRHFYAKSKLPN